MEASQRERVVQIAKTWLRTPYHSNARVKGAGVDCGMLLLAVFEEAGLMDHVEVGYYSEQWHLHRSAELYLQWVEKYCRLIDYEKPLSGDIALFQFGRTLSHGAIVVDWPLVIHSYNEPGGGVMYADVTKYPLEGRLKRVYTLCG
jgi:cell wall-associated NlpC family hydrolase